MDRKAAIRQFKERKPYRGVYEIRSTATGSVWVGASPDLHAARNGEWFALRLGTHRDSGLQREWGIHGEPAFTFKVLEELDEDVLAMSVRDLLKEKRQKWALDLGARVLL